MPEKTITIGLSEEEFERFDKIKNEAGLTWRGLFLRAIRPSTKERLKRALEKIVSEGKI